MLPQTLGIIGLGAVGGSVAWDATQSGVPRVVGYSRSTRDAVAAVKAGAVTGLMRDAAAVVEAADLVVFATPPADTLELLETLGPAMRERGVFGTDVTSIKVQVMRVAEAQALQEVFAGSHPLLGTHETGFTAARPSQLRGSVVYVTPLAGGSDAGREIEDFWSRAVGAHPVTIDADRHDAMVAWTGQLPHVVAATLAGALAKHGPAGVTHGRTALEATRAASSSPEAWAEILIANRRQVLEALRHFGGEVDALREALDEDNLAKVRRSLEAGAGWRRRFDE